MIKKIPLTCPCEPCKGKISLKRLDNLFICENINCEHNKIENGFQIINSIPVIISEIKTDTICTKNSFKTYVERPLVKFTSIKKFIIGESNTTRKNCDKFIENLFLKNKNPKVLIIGGAEKGSGAENLWNNEKIEIHSLDIYASENVDIICDSHYLCLEDGYYDGVWIQAVLEHVVEPIVVVNEIYRVLNFNGIVYAETPFMQQVHEGAYDFTRYTVLGHRYLFKKFKQIEIGGNNGPEVVFAWSIRYLIWSLFRSKELARVVALFIGLIMRPLKLITSKKSMYDASSGVFFLGSKVDNQNLTHKDLVNLYKGQF